MKKAKIKTGFVGLRLVHLQKRKTAIIADMTGNIHFPTLAAMVAEIKVIGDEFDSLMVQIQAGNLALIARRDVCVYNLTNKLTVLGNYITVIAEQDYEILCTTGFGLHKQRTPLGPVAKPEGLKIKDGPYGGLKARIKKQAAAVSYLYEYTTHYVGDETIWQCKRITSVTCILDDLESGKRYWVRVGAADKNNNIVYCDPVTRVVQ